WARCVALEGDRGLPPNDCRSKCTPRVAWTDRGLVQADRMDRTAVRPRVRVRPQGQCRSDVPHARVPLRQGRYGLSLRFQPRGVHAPGARRTHLPMRLAPEGPRRLPATVRAGLAAVRAYVPARNRDATLLVDPWAARVPNSLPRCLGYGQVVRRLSTNHAPPPSPQPDRGARQACARPRRATGVVRRDHLGASGHRPQAHGGVVALIARGQDSDRGTRHQGGLVSRLPLGYRRRRRATADRADRASLDARRSGAPGAPPQQPWRRSLATTGRA